MNTQNIYNEIVDYCIRNANPELVAKYSRYFKEGYDAYGLSHELFESKVNEIMQLTDFNIDRCYQLANILLPSTKYEYTSFAYLLINKFKKQFNKDTFNNISNWFDIGIYNWGHTDVISGEILSPMLINKTIDFNDFKSWTLSDRKFKRRAVAVSLIKYIKDKNPIDPLLKLLEPYMSDTERVVHQGMGWFLREAWKINPELIEKFLLKWKETAPRLIFQYACEKMTKEQKADFAKTKNKH